MFTHDSIWLAIDRLANSLGYSTSGLAKRAGLDPTTFNRSKRLGPDGKPRWPSTESIARVLDATNSTMADFLSLIEAGTTGTKTQAMIPLLGLTHALQDHHFDVRGVPKGDGWDMIHFPHPQGVEQTLYALEIGTDITHPFFRTGDRLIEAGTTGTKTQAMIPLLGLTHALQDHHFDVRGVPKGDGWDMIHFPHPQGNEQTLYALEIGTDITHPFFRTGDRLIVVPDAAIRRGDRVVVKTQSGELLLQELVRQTAGKIDLKSLTSPYTEISHTMKDILWVARIVWVSQ